MRDVDRIHPQPVLQPVSFGHRAVFIKETGVRHDMRLQKLRRLPPPRTFLRRDVHQLRSCLFDLSFHWLQLSRALHAVRSPSATQELHDQRSA